MQSLAKEGGVVQPEGRDSPHVTIAATTSSEATLIFTATHYIQWQYPVKNGLLRITYDQTHGNSQRWGFRSKPQNCNSIMRGQYTNPYGLTIEDPEAFQLLAVELQYYYVVIFCYILESSILKAIKDFILTITSRNNSYILLMSTRQSGCNARPRHPDQSTLARRG